ncbi:MAG: type II toxin-antitoxin system HicA family toxin [Bacteroidetes bacterium]|nr:type II toxin-antitoxin system HicA family toxin [Bacteroidota bacterium]MCW5895569.1 type II toxin-antitoxin system HicA family toxin [Bacteroidota bacterium]
MGKMRVLSGKEVCQILSKHSFEAIRQKGSHIIMQKKMGTSTITVPVPNHKEIKPGTLKSIIRQSQVSPKEFET